MTAIDDVIVERARQRAASIGGDTDRFDTTNTRNDWVALVNAYTGRAADKSIRNQSECQDFRQNMVKAAALCVAAIEAHDKGDC